MNEEEKNEISNQTTDQKSEKLSKKDIEQLDKIIEKLLSVKE